MTMGGGGRGYERINDVAGWLSMCCSMQDISPWMQVFWSSALSSVVGSPKQAHMTCKQSRGGTDVRY